MNTKEFLAPQYLNLLSGGRGSSAWKSAGLWGIMCRDPEVPGSNPGRGPLK